MNDQVFFFYGQEQFGDGVGASDHRAGQRALHGAAGHHQVGLSRRPGEQFGVSATCLESLLLHLSPPECDVAHLVLSL